MGFVLLIQSLAWRGLVLQARDSAGQGRYTREQGGLCSAPAGWRAAA